MAPIAASVESKSKLAAFRFEQDAIKPLHDAQDRGAIEDKENNPTTRDQDGNSLPQPESNLQSLSQKSASRDIRECPQTPVGRLPLSELIASTEDINGQSLITTPVERVLWNHTQQAEGSSSLQAARTKKRPRSSSPVSSSQNETSTHVDPWKPSVDLQTIQKTLETPKADPAADLWSRYSLNTDPNIDRRSPTESAGAFCAMQCSSPQTPAKHLKTKDFGGLRRSFSCGIEWPASASKRRRTKHSSAYRETNLGFAVLDSGRSENRESKMARVSLLVEDIQKRLARPATGHPQEVVGPSSSSPLPDKVDFPAHSVTSPIRHSLIDGGHLIPAASPNEARYQPLRNAADSGAEESKFQNDRLSSDFDDDDLDLVLLKNIDKGARVDLSVQNLVAEPPRLSSSDYGLSSSQPECNTDTPNLRMNGQEELALQPMNSGKSQSVANPDTPRSHPCAAVAEPILDQFDEFDEVDNDMFEADLEDVAAMYDLEPHNHVEQAINLARHPESPHNSQSGEKAFSLAGKVNSVRGADEDEVLSDDEFGGDVDFEEIVAECEEASQRPQLASQFQSSVRSKLFGPPL